MEHRSLGASGLKVPVIGMGTWLTFDVHASADIEDRRRVVDTAIAAGTTLFDTSPMYGASEEVLGRLLAGRRDQAIVADKVWTSSAREGREQVEQALRWYGGTVDIYQVHNLVAWREHLPMLEEHQARGDIRVLGATHYQHSALRDLMTVMRTGRIQVIQVPYNAADRLVEREVLPLAAELGIGVLVMQPLGTGKLVRSAPSQRDLEPLERFGVRTWAQALLKWIVSDPRVDAVLPATRHAERAVENAVAGTPPWFDDETREYVARLAAR